MILHAAWRPSVRVFRAPSQQETTWERDRMNASSIRTPFVLWGSLDWPRRQGTMHCKMRMMMKRSANWSAQGSAMIFLPALPYPLSRSITILISRRRARVSERMRTRKRWARVGREKGEAGSRCGPFTREWGKRKIEINRLHETHTHTRVFVRMHHMRNCEPDSTMIPAPKKWRHRDSDNRPKFPRVAVHADSVRPYGAPQNESRHIC